jgi:Yip1 domain
MTFSERVIGAARLDPRVYEEVEADTSATGQAFAVIALAMLAEAIGASPFGVAFLVPILIRALIGWMLWAGMIYLVGVYLLPEPQTNATLGQLLRTIGFAASPGLLRILAFVPLLGWLVRFVVWIWLIMTTVVAVRQALDLSTVGRALAVCLIASLVDFVALMILAIAFAGTTVFTARSLIW